ncbi:hypothetical protein [Cohnella sp. JJ-181]|uniref:hypothetical protein n=1 Tax=Cohnella rhizoplanae TaxID=2974897 RepID=UPI0022FFC02A|nr:hypothetical protein [Cohnella sp. JJ-181]CAI6029621.1 hypothetical protein COHCIP112018_00647 [Cohnella sp. JJ-181]
MRTLLEMFGFVIMVGGTVVGVMSGSFSLIVFSLVGGLVLLALSHLIGIAESVQARVLDLPPTLDTVRNRIRHASDYAVTAADIEIYPAQGAMHSLVELDENLYMRTFAFMKHLSVLDRRYSFSLPGREPVELHGADRYFQGADLFSVDGYAYVKLSAIGLAADREGDRILLRSRQDARADDQ